MSELIRAFKTKKKSTYLLYPDGNLVKNGHNLEKGFYVSSEFLSGYSFESEDDYFSTDVKKRFIEEASKINYEKTGGRLVFFKSKNPLKLEMSSIVEEFLQPNNLESKLPEDSAAEIIFD